MVKIGRLAALALTSSLLAGVAGIGLIAPSSYAQPVGQMQTAPPAKANGDAKNPVNDGLAGGGFIL